MASPRRLLLLCALLVPVWSALAQEVSVVSRREGEAVIVEALTELAVTPEQAWGPLTDYDNLARFIPDMQQSRVIERTGQRVLVEQQGSAGLFFLRRSIEVRLDIEESPHAWITARAVSGSFREMQGRYDIEPVAGVNLQTLTRAGRGSSVTSVTTSASTPAAVISHASSSRRTRDVDPGGSQATTGRTSVGSLSRTVAVSAAARGNRTVPRGSKGGRTKPHS